MDVLSIRKGRLVRWLKICAGAALATLIAVGAGVWWQKSWTDRWEKSLEQDHKALALPGAVLLQPGRVAVPLPPPLAGSPPPMVMDNSLLMKFRPIPRSEALMCIWETRIRGYKVHGGHADGRRSGMDE